MRKLTLLVLFAYQSLAGFGQLSPANITGNIESIFQYLNEDTIIGASQPAEKGLVNSYMNLFYTQGNVKAGIRVESYLPRINGYPTVFDGTGIGYSNIQIIEEIEKLLKINLYKNTIVGASAINFCCIFYIHFLYNINGYFCSETKP